MAQIRFTRRANTGLALSGLALALAAAQPLYAAESPRLHGIIDYELGGSSLPPAPTSATTIASIEIGGGWNTNLACGKFDLATTMKNQFEGLTDGFTDYMDTVLTNATSAITSLPALALQRANPGLYSLIESGVMQGKLDIEASTGSCEGFQNFILDGDKSGLPWMSITKSATERQWQNEIASNGGDIIKARKEVRDNDAGDLGVTWVCGNQAGGVGQNTIKSTADVIIAGYNILHKKNDVCDNGSPPAAMIPTSAIARYWPQARDAAEWAVAAVGEKELAACDGCNKLEGTAGKGLEFMLRDETETVADILQDLVDGARDLTWQNLEEVSANPQPRINASLIRELQNMNPTSQAGYIDRISQEVAYARLLEQTRLMIQMFHTAQREPNIAAFAAAQPHISEAVAMLESNLDLISSESDRKQQIAARTVKGLMVAIESESRGAVLPGTVAADRTDSVYIGE